MGRFRDWARAEAAAILRPEFDALRDETQRSLRNASDGLLQRITLEHEQTRRQVLERQAELGDYTRRIVEAVDQMHARLDAYRSAQQTQLQTLEGTLRELRSAISPSTAPRPTVVAGSIEPAPRTTGRNGGEIDLTDQYCPGTLVEARSRFRDGWFDGLEVAETVEEAGGERYRLTRRRDGRQLPMLFDAVDLRLAAVASSEVQTG